MEGTLRHRLLPNVERASTARFNNPAFDPPDGGGAYAEKRNPATLVSAGCKMGRTRGSRAGKRHRGNPERRWVTWAKIWFGENSPIPRWGMGQGMGEGF